MKKIVIKLIKVSIFILVSISVLRRFLFYNKIVERDFNGGSQTTAISDDRNVIIWWTNFIGDMEYERQCDNGVKCFFSENRDLINHQNFLGFIFYGSNMNTINFPLPRQSSHQWALFHEESPKNVPFLLYEETLRLFNYTATFSRFSDFPLTFQHLKSLELLTTNKYFVATETKNQFQNTMENGKNLAPVLYVQSICSTMSGRDEYIQELSKYIRIDSYGGCLNNRKMPDSLTIDYMSTIDSDEYYKFIARYKFVIAYENGICDDYITEKLWRPLIVGAIPIYYGSPKITDWLPNNKSAILIQDFPNPMELGNFLLNLNLNNTEYNSYLNHKNNNLNNINVKITNENFLINYKKFSNILLRNNNEILETFECDLCRKLYQQKTSSSSSYNNNGIKSSEIINKYKCYYKNKIINSLNFINENIMDLTLIDSPENESKRKPIYDYDMLRQGKCEAKLIYDIVTKKNYRYTEMDFNRELLFRYDNNVC